MAAVQPVVKDKYADSGGETLTLLQAAFVLQMHPSYVGALVRNGTIPSAKDGRKVTIKRSDLVAYKAGHDAGTIGRGARGTREKGPGGKIVYVPMAIQACKRVLGMVDASPYDDATKDIVKGVLNDFLAAGVQEWENKKAAKAAEAAATPAA